MAKEKTKHLKLVLKSKWFEMIKDGGKREEYRELKPHYHRILKGRDYDKVTFYLGYKKDRPSMTFNVTGIEVGTGREEWGAEKGVEYYVIKFC